MTTGNKRGQYIYRNTTASLVTSLTSEEFKDEFKINSFVYVKLIQCLLYEANDEQNLQRLAMRKKSANGLNNTTSSTETFVEDSLEF